MVEGNTHIVWVFDIGSQAPLQNHFHGPKLNDLFVTLLIPAAPSG